jgi:hypothetical protein
VATAHPVTLFDLPGDPGYAGVAALAERLGQGTIEPRPATIAATADRVAELLRAPSPLEADPILA